jgi:hypothetical protein
VQTSPGILEALLRFYERRTEGDPARFDEVVSDEMQVFIGTAPGEWFEGKEAIRPGFGVEGLTLAPGPNPRGWEAGSLGLAADEPLMTLPDGTVIRTRLTAVFRHENGSWKLATAHFSAGVPDDEVQELQRRWLGK